MKKCYRCKIVFHLDARPRCLYCDSLLQPVQFDDTMAVDDYVDVKNMRAHLVALKMVLKDRFFDDLGRMEYLVGSYFRSRTFKFLYFFSRSELLMGPDWRRMFIQKINVTYVLRLPWLFVDVLDSFYLRLFYNAHCEKCNWKYKKYFGRVDHDPALCEYCQEYGNVIENILNGKIIKSEEDFVLEAEKKRKAGKRSAYYDLATARKPKDVFIDVLSIWTSVWVLITLFIYLLIPFFMKMVELLGEIHMELK